MRKFSSLTALFVLTVLAGSTFAQAQDADGYYRVGGTIKAPTKITNVAPVYPEAARAAGVDGVVILALKINTQGTVAEARVLRSVPGLDDAALTAASQWTYQPILLNGAPVPVIYNVTVSFSLQSAQASGGQATAPAGTPPSGRTAPDFADAVTPTADTGQPPLRVGGVIRAPTKVYDVPPVYPLLAQQAAVEGTVILELLVDPNGLVADAKVIRSIPLLDEAALDAVRQWIYTPTMLNGVPVSIYYNVTVTFSLTR